MNAEDHIAEHLNVDAAQAEHDQGAEAPVEDRADNRLATASRHLLHQDRLYVITLHSVLGQIPHHLLVSTLHLVLGTQA